MRRIEYEFDTNEALAAPVEDTGASPFCAEQQNVPGNDSFQQQVPSCDPDCLAVFKRGGPDDLGGDAAGLDAGF